MPTTETTPRSPAESARTALEEVRDALRELTQAMTKLERTVRASRRNPQRRPPRTEVGFIDVASTEIESTVTKTSWSGATREVVVKTGMNQFVVYALGPNGRYEVVRSRQFKAHPGSLNLVQRLAEDPAESGSILNEFLASLMQDGWVITPPGPGRDGYYRGWIRHGKVEGDGQHRGWEYRFLGLRRTVID